MKELNKRKATMNPLVKELIRTNEALKAINYVLANTDATLEQYQAICELRTATEDKRDNLNEEINQ